MRLLTAFRFGLMPNPTATSTGAAVGEAVEALATRTGMHIAAIIPTTSGQIGVNPVSILPPASVFRGTVYDSDAPTATTVTTGGHTETHKVYFAVATNAAGDLDISIVDPDLRSFLEKTAEEVPACAISKLRRRLRSILLRREACGALRYMDEFESYPSADEIIQDLTDQIASAAPDHPAVKEYLELETVPGSGSGSGGSDVVETVELSLMSEEELTLLQASAGPVTGAMGLGFLTYIFHVFNADKAAAKEGEKVAITGVHIPSNSIQTVTETKTTSTSTTSTVSCADPSKTDLFCLKDDCEIDLPLTEDTKFVCKGGKYEGCDCATEAVVLSLPITKKEDAMMKLLADNLVFNDIPTHPKLSNYGECGTSNENMESSTWFNLVQKLCTDTKHYKLDKDFSVEYTAEDVFASGYEDDVFEFYLKKNEGVECKNPCTQIFNDGFSGTSCHYDSHTRSRSGSIKLDCGEAGYEIRNAKSKASGPQCADNDWSPLPSNVWNGPAGNIYGVFCQNVTPDKKLEITIDPSGKADPVRWLKRSPPPDPSLYEGYRVDFLWNPNEDSGVTDCELSCDGAMEAFGASTCGHKGSGMRKMSTSASYNVGCGTYSYRIRKKRHPWTLGEQKCYKPDQFGAHKDVSPPLVRTFSKKACKNVQGYKIVKGDSDSVLHHEFTNGGVKYHFEAGWDNSCALEEKRMEEVNAWKPLGEKSDARCESLFANNYKNCNNGGVGGEIMAGCVKYIFKALPE
ncbi:hypothetical protein AUP68_05263 [Ilyonectria robusta]